MTVTIDPGSLDRDDMDDSDVILRTLDVAS